MSKKKFHSINIFLIKYKIKNKYVALLFILFILIPTFNYYIKNDIRICLCAIAKNENLYIREFVEHYKKNRI